MLTPEQLTTHPFLQRVGPDVLIESDAGGGERTIIVAAVKIVSLLDYCSIRRFWLLGNYLRVEILWQVGLTGNHKAKDLNAAQLDALAHALLEILDFPTLRGAGG